MEWSQWEWESYTNNPLRFRFISGRINKSPFSLSLVIISFKIIFDIGLFPKSLKHGYFQYLVKNYLINKVWSLFSNSIIKNYFSNWIMIFKDFQIYIVFFLNCMKSTIINDKIHLADFFIIPLKKKVYTDTQPCKVLYKASKGLL